MHHAMGSCIQPVKGMLSFRGTEHPVRIQEIMRKENYIQILDENMKESAEKL